MIKNSKLLLATSLMLLVLGATMENNYNQANASHHIRVTKKLYDNKVHHIKLHAAIAPDSHDGKVKVYFNKNLTHSKKFGVSQKGITKFNVKYYKKINGNKYYYGNFEAQNMRKVKGGYEVNYVKITGWISSKNVNKY